MWIGFFLLVYEIDRQCVVCEEAVGKYAPHVVAVDNHEEAHCRSLRVLLVLAELLVQPFCDEHQDRVDKQRLPVWTSQMDALRVVADRRFGRRQLAPFIVESVAAEDLKAVVQPRWVNPE